MTPLAAGVKFFQCTCLILFIEQRFHHFPGKYESQIMSCGAQIRAGDLVSCPLAVCRSFNLSTRTLVALRVCLYAYIVAHNDANCHSGSHITRVIDIHVLLVAAAGGC